ncbi:hypothetical protein CCACVL1_29353 [Corchorus capsularis]|uniref:Uncharacterized protein n=1 Tax=Corchorus capsularis TaxID=210143 RepID=A0A1R3G216_COCAP|nr:hypothetical protein CCACVL1_29353 [Corchorus capsularis]
MAEIIHTYCCASGQQPHLLPQLFWKRLNLSRRLLKSLPLPPLLLFFVLHCRRHWCHRWPILKPFLWLPLLFHLFFSFIHSNSKPSLSHSKPALPPQGFTINVVTGPQRFSTLFANSKSEASANQTQNPKPNSLRSTLPESNPTFGYAAGSFLIPIRLNPSHFLLQNLQINFPKIFPR